MSRFDEALRRAAQAGDAVAPDHLQDAAREAKPVRLSDVFRSPWDVETPQPEPMAPGHDRDLVDHSSSPDRCAPFRGLTGLDSERLVNARNVENDMATTIAIEQYRRLGATLIAAQAERNVRVVIVTSGIAGEGKTLTAANVALTMSESYRRHVLLIDADLRRPSLDRIFHVAAASGLNDRSGANSEQTIPIATITARLALLPAGPVASDPMNVLASPRTNRIIKQAADRFDWVIIDAPPLGLLTDAKILSATVDGAIIVVQAGKTDYTIVRRAVDGIGRERVLGVVLNGVGVHGYSYGYGYGRYYAAYRTGGRP